MTHTQSEEFRSSSLLAAWARPASGLGRSTSLRAVGQPTPHARTAHHFVFAPVLHRDGRSARHPAPASERHAPPCLGMPSGTYSVSPWPVPTRTYALHSTRTDVRCAVHPQSNPFANAAQRLGLSSRLSARANHARSPRSLAQERLALPSSRCRGEITRPPSILAAPDTRGSRTPTAGEKRFDPSIQPAT